MKFFRLLLAVVLLAAQSLAQQASEKVQETPSDVLANFRSHTDVVLVPVVVNDKHGKHIGGLNKEAFRIEENGKEQVISSFEEVQSDNIRNPATAAVDLGYSNLPFDNAQQLRLTIMVLDLLNTSPLQRTDGKEQLTKFLQKGLAGSQPVSLLCITMHGVQLVQPFTTDTAVLIQALQKTSPGGERIMSRQDAVFRTLDALSEIAKSYAGIPGRKTMILASGNIPDPVLSSGAFASTTTDYALGVFQKTWKSLIDSNIAVYPIELLDWSHNPGSRRQASYVTSLQNFADATGGNRCVETRNVNECLAQAVEDSRAYYVLVFTVRPDDRKPGWRDLKVKVAAEHADVRARSGFYYGTPANEKAASARDEEINALASSLAYSAIPMYVRPLPPAASADPAPGSKITVEFLVTIPLSGVKVETANSSPLDLEIGAIALTRDTREAGEFLHSVRADSKPEALKQFAREGIKLREKLELPPGSYDVRFMVRDNNARQIGTVVFPLEVK